MPNFRGVADLKGRKIGVTAPALANAIARANRWIQAAGPGDIIKAVPEACLLGERAVCIDAFLAARGALSPDGLFPDKGAETACRALASIALVLDALVGLIEKRLMKWQPRSGETEKL